VVRVTVLELVTIIIVGLFVFLFLGALYMIQTKNKDRER
jgi:hypothetical protein